MIMAAFGLVIGLWVACWFGLKCLIPDQETRGQFGDQFGTVNSLFAGLAFSAVALTLYYQYREDQRTQDRFRKEMDQLEKDRVDENKKFKVEIERRQGEFAKQTRLQALTAYAELHKELWQHCERQYAWYRDHNETGNKNMWDKYRSDRYKQTMEALEQLEKVLKETR